MLPKPANDNNGKWVIRTPLLGGTRGEGGVGKFLRKL